MNAQLLIKAAFTVALVLLASVLARRPGVVGALVASLPITSLLVLGWLYAETRDVQRVATMSMDIFWFVLGSLPFFPALSLSLRAGLPTWLAFVIAAAAGFIGVTAVQFVLVHTRAGT